MERKARVLLVGLDPVGLDYSKAPIPGMTAEILTAALEAENAKLEALGYHTRMLYTDSGKTAEAVVQEALTQDQYDCVLIGAGLRLVPDYFLLFEKLINVVHRHAPASVRISFNTRPNDTAEAVQRWV